MKKIAEHTYGFHTFMKVMIIVNNAPEFHEIDVYWDGPKTLYKTTADNDPVRRDLIINAFNTLY